MHDLNETISFDKSSLASSESGSLNPPMTIPQKDLLSAAICSQRICNIFFRRLLRIDSSVREDIRKVDEPDSQNEEQGEYNFYLHHGPRQQLRKRFHKNDKRKTNIERHYNVAVTGTYSN